MDIVRSGVLHRNYFLKYMPTSCELDIDAPSMRETIATQRVQASRARLRQSSRLRKLQREGGSDLQVTSTSTYNISKNFILKIITFLPFSYSTETSKLNRPVHYRPQSVQPSRSVSIEAWKQPCTIYTGKSRNALVVRLSFNGVSGSVLRIRNLQRIF